MNLANVRRNSYGVLYLLIFVLALFAVFRFLLKQNSKGSFEQNSKGSFESHFLRSKADPLHVAISPDGKQVVMVHRQSIGSNTNQIDLFEVSSGQQVTTSSLPRAQDLGQHPNYYVTKPVSYCNNGKYILAFDDDETLYVLNSGTLYPHTLISLTGLRILLGDPKRKLETLMRTNRVSVTCAQHSPLALVAFELDGGGVVSLMDLDTASDLKDVSGTFQSKLNFGASAISPSGEQIAVVRSGSMSSSSRDVEILEARTQKKLFSTVLALDEAVEVAFAGESALVISERGCPENVCSTAPIPHHRTLIVWNFGEDGRLRNFGVEGAETYKWTGASADGNVVYAYTGIERFCTTCNGSLGELKIDDARVMLWDRNTGQSLARSPKLRVENHPCFAVQILASCTAYQQSPELQLSEDGNAILAFWPRGDAPPEKDEEREMQVLTRK